MQQHLHDLYIQILQTTLPELVGVIFGVLSVWLATKNNIWVFPTGIISTSIYIYLCFIQNLQANAVLNLYYTIMSFWGLYNWLKKSNNEDLYPISYTTNREKVMGLFIFFLVFVSLFFVLQKVKSDLPLWDALSSAFAALGMFWMTRRKIENWIAWILSNSIAIPLFYSLGYVFSSLQYFLFLILAIYGIIKWDKEWKKSLI